MIKVVKFYILLIILGFIDFSALYLQDSILRRERSLFTESYLKFVEDRTAGWVHRELRRDSEYINIRGPHLNHSRDLILNAAQLSLREHDLNQPKRALIIGAGNCLDIPIKELVGMFDEIYLLDVAYKTTETIARDGRYLDLREEDGRWITKEEFLSPEERSKIKFVLSDATGGVAFEIAARVEALIENEVVTKDDVLKLFEDLTANQLPFNDGYFNFISSSTVLSALLNLIENYVITVLGTKDAYFHINDIEVGEALLRLNEEISRFQLRESYRMLADSGRLYLSASRFVAEVFTPLGAQDGRAGEFLPEGRFIRHLVREISMPEDIISLTSNYFSIFTEEQPELNLWLWSIDGDMAIGVQALTLAKRAENFDLNNDQDVELTSVLVETADNIYFYDNPNKDAREHFIVSIPDHIMNEGLFVLNNRLNYLIRDEFGDTELFFGKDFIPHLYATSLVLINRKDLRNIFFGDESRVVNSVILNGKITLTRLVRIANAVYLNNVDFKAAVYVGSGWSLENVHAERSIFSESMAADETLLSNAEVINTYLGFGVDVKTGSIKNTIVPEGRVLWIEVDGIMAEERALAGYLALTHDESEVERLLNGEIRVPGSDIDNLFYAGRVTSLAVAFCLLLEQGESHLVESYMRSIPQDLEIMIRERMSVVAVFIDSNLYKIIKGLSE